MACFSNRTTIDGFAGTNVDQPISHSRNISSDDPFSPAAAAINPDLYVSRRGTPSVPPGFEGSVSSKPVSRIGTPRVMTPIKPALPLQPTPHKAIDIADSAKPLYDRDSLEKKEEIPAKTPINHQTPEIDVKTAVSAIAVPETADVEAKKASKPTTRKNSTANAKSIASVSATPTATRAVQQPATPKKTEIPQTVYASKKPDATPDNGKGGKQPTSSTKRQPPGKLDIPAATATAEAEKKPYKLVPNSVPHTPATTTASTGSPVKKAPSKVLRVVQTPRTETPVPISASSSVSNVLPQLPTGRLASRQASIASINIPGTPHSFDVSDVASLASTSVSRASSPPPNAKSKVATVRTKTKSQVKKERQERGKQKTAEKVEEAVSAKSVDDVMQEPIIGRKKKAKKPSKTPAAAVASKEREASRPASPALKVGFNSKEQSRPPSPQAKALPILEESMVAEPEPVEEHVPSPVDILAKLEDMMDTAFFKGPSAYPKGEVTPADLDNLEKPIPFTPNDLENIAKDVPVQLGGHDGRDSSRCLVVDQGVLHGLPPSMEEFFLELDARIKATLGPGKYRHQSTRDPKKMYPTALPSFAAGLQNARNVADHQNNTNGGNNSVKCAPFDDAASYINQWVIPTDPTATAGYMSRQTQNPPQVTTAGIPGISLPLEEASELLDGHLIRSIAAGDFRTAFMTHGMTFEEVERQYHESRKELERHEKQLSAMLKKNRKILSNGGH
ncbi:hypothetical protein EJ05DRAFT_113787 [Pseudovirgaria hyperparasitica]|uniref:Uncharacterized protein n=1 Tax=Pseudovirgaria hyperparasitica TaxID=470096 RepID=A0A6A6W0S1_9PEZI|nr:uncharacterized protein EJ05DRAFT_113787 [Pseudovirgaria hyperparasitica]KAF2755739.1 hypothetical protein EJ05DRAFT_113787 [Pseudovirgaria hyperparasitica]